ncbi:hypothetical protein JCM33374_g499 [Metschnikowia sp. JCM 33374]|nr:hypothetical protein JCM33374_g499 [Metschnikowia sp. JCM 33374]
MIFASKFRFGATSPVAPAASKKSSDASEISKTRTIKKVWRTFRWRRKAASSSRTATKKSDPLQKKQATKELGIFSPNNPVSTLKQTPSQVLATICDTNSDAYQANPKNQNHQVSNTRVGVQKKVRFAHDLVTTYSPPTTYLSVSEETSKIETMYTSPLTEILAELGILSAVDDEFQSYSEQDIAAHYQEEISFSNTPFHLQHPQSAQQVFDSVNFSNKWKAPQSCDIDNPLISESFHQNRELYNTSNAPENTFAQTSESLDDAGRIQTNSGSEISSFKALIAFLREIKLVKTLSGKIKRACVNSKKNKDHPVRNTEAGSSPMSETPRHPRENIPLTWSAPSPETTEALLWRERRALRKAGGVPVITKQLTTTSKPKVNSQVKKEIETSTNTSRTSSFSTGSWLVRNKSQYTLWNMLSLDTRPQCWSFKSEFSRNEGFTLFLDAMKRVQAISPLSLLVLTFIKDGGNISKNFRKTLSNIDLLVEGSTSPSPPPIVSFSTKHFKLPFSPTEREALDNSFSILLKMCKKKVKNFERNPQKVKVDETLEFFRHCFELPRKTYVSIAKKQIIIYVYEMAKLRQEIFSLFEHLCDIGNKYAHALEYLSNSMTSTNSLFEAQTMLTILSSRLTNARCQLVEVQTTLLQMEQGLEEYVTEMIVLARDAINRGIEFSDIYKALCQTDMAKHLGTAKLESCTEFSKLSNELEFLVDCKEAMKPRSFQEALKYVQHSRNTFADVQGDLEINICKILTGISELQSGMQDPMPRSFIETVGIRPSSAGAYDSSRPL